MRVSDDARFYLFWLVCLPVRAAIAYGGFALVKVDDVFYILFSIYTALTSAGFLAFSLLWWSYGKSLVFSGFPVVLR